jgi:hypothetical protein
LAFFFLTKYFASVRQARASSRHHSFEKDFSEGKFSSINTFVLFVENVSENARGDWQTKGLII